MECLLTGSWIRLHSRIGNLIKLVVVERAEDTFYNIEYTDLQESLSAQTFNQY